MQPWEQQPQEPPRWYARFEIFRRMGPRRTLNEAFRIAGEAEGFHGKSASGSWKQQARLWKWRERAEAWDAAQREVLQMQEQERPLDSRAARLRMIDHLLATVFDALVLANLPNLEEMEARKWLPTMRLLFKDLVLLQRGELGLPGPVGDADDRRQATDDVPPYTADELAAAQRELETWEARDWPPTFQPPQSLNLLISQSPKKLLALTGPDPSLAIDLAALRTVKAESGLDFHRIEQATRDDLDAYLRRERSHGRPVQYLHIASHADHTGVQFADGLADGAWLSAMLQGVQVLVLAGCRSDRVGDWLGVVPHVVSLADKISHQDAAILTQHFWSEIACGAGPDEALSAALRRCPPVVSEFVVKHW